jgi:hypothetical protein
MTSPPEAAAAVSCSTCQTANPSSARFCATCGSGLQSGDRSRGARYAANPSESVASFALISTIMPHASARAPQTYRLALLLGLALPLVGGVLGALPFALATAAFVVPVVYIVYLYDVNLWEDAPVSVVAAAFGLSSLLGLGFTLLWREGLFADTFELTINRRTGVVDLTELLVLCVLVPAVATVLMLLGPMYLASRPKFDDLMDGLTFGIVSGTAYAAFETLVVNRSLLSGSLGGDIDGALWLSLILNLALIKPIVYGSAIGIAAAQFSGLGERYDGFTGRFFARVLEAFGFIAAYQAGLYLTGLVEGSTGAVLGLLWGAVVAAALIVRVRTVLHHALVEGAIEAAARGGGSKWASGAHTYCGECEMPVLENAMFCVICGTSVRAQSKVGRTVSTPSAQQEVSA